LFQGMMAGKQSPKARFSTKLPNGDFLGITIWPGKSEPSAEVVTVQIRHPTGDNWETTARIALYRTPDGKYSLLPEKPVTKSSEKTEAVSVGATERD
jgi:hypothetical protein